MARSNYSNPPLFGARLINAVCEKPELKEQWKMELKMMAERILLMRESLVTKLKERQNPHNWQHIKEQKGMFAFTGLSEEMVKELRAKYAIYLTLDGRVSISGLNTHNIDYVADAFHSVTKDRKF